MALYQSLRAGAHELRRTSEPFFAHEGPMLSGYQVANTDQPGILTLDRHVRLHSCEKGARCKHLNAETVWIRPIITRTASGEEIAEMGVGGGGGDLNQRAELVLESDVIIHQLMES